jgi:hypothetical protein
MTGKAFAHAFACVLLVSTVASAAGSRKWQTGILTETEQQKVQEGSTKNSTTDGSIKQRGNKTDYSQNTTTTQTDNLETYQIYTIEAAEKVYVAREHLLFPWSKPASVAVGEPVKFSLEKGKLYILDADEKEHKATVTKVSLKSGH